jgi:hypothetical protein
MTDTITPKPPRIYRHVSRKDWGDAVLLEELEDRRIFRFEDGKERSIGVNYLDKMELVELSADDAYAIQARALAGLEPRRGKKVRVPREKKPPKKPDVTFEDQLAAFKGEFQIGFDDVTFRPSTFAKAIKRAAGALSREKLSSMIEAGDFGAVHGAAVKVIEGFKSGVPKGERDKLKSLPASSHEAFARALQGWLYGEGDPAERFDALARSLGEAAGWQLVTTFGALVTPNDQLYVRPSVMRKQALIVDVFPKAMKNPSGRVYLQLLAAGQRVREKLDAAGQRPADLLDVAHFSLRTLKSPPKKGAAAQ